MNIILEKKYISFRIRLLQLSFIIFYWCCCGEEEASIVESNLIDVSNTASPSKEKDKLGDDDMGTNISPNKNVKSFAVS